MNKRQQKQIEFYKTKLNIITDGELFVLEHILKRDWNRDIILIDIEMIKYNHQNCQGLIWVKCSTRNGSYNFSVPHLGGVGWVIDNLEVQKCHIGSQLYHKMD